MNPRQTYQEQNDLLRALAAEGARQARGEFAGRPVTPHVVQLVTGFVYSFIEQRCSIPFDLRVNSDGLGNLIVNVKARPMCPAMPSDLDPPLRSIETPQPVAPKAKTISFSEPGVDGCTGSFIHVQGMIAELAAFRVPPDLFEGEPTGFNRAIADVIAYLGARSR